MSHGGKRAGAGRKKGSRNKCTSLDSAKLKALAQEMAVDAMDIVLEIARNGKDDRIRLDAAKHIIDRAVGKPTAQETTSEGNDFGNIIMEINRTGSAAPIATAESWKAHLQKDSDADDGQENLFDA